MEAIQHIKLPEGFDIRGLEEVLTEEYICAPEVPISEGWTFYDTFDWRLFNKSLTLHQSGETLFLRRLPDGETAQKLIYPSMPEFAGDFPDSSLRDQIGVIIEPRALLKLAEVNVQSRTYRILNIDEKTVARLVLTEAHTNDLASINILATYLSLLPVRGYPKYGRQIGEFIKQMGEPVSVWVDIYRGVLEAVGNPPGSYTGKLDLQLDPNTRSDQAAKIILRRLLEVMKANEAGLRADIDSEFLHDFRVSIRRTRSALSQLRGVFPPDVVDRFKGDFAYLGTSTNRLRDLDVYLLSEDRYRDMLPERMGDDISPLFDLLRAQRAGALQEVIEVLDSDRYAHILRDWENLLNEPVAEEVAGDNAAVPIIETAHKRIYKRYRRVIKDGKSILDNPQDELMHVLRIDCKKLRYLIEFFASLYPAKKVAQLIDQLKNLQDNLGEFNDLSVQQDYLMTITEQLSIRDTSTRRALVATGYLIDNLDHRQQVVRADFAETFTTFASPPNQQLFRQLYGDKGKRSAS